MEEINGFAGSRATVNGKEVDFNMIMPTSSHAMERSDMEDDAQTLYTNMVMFDSL